MVRPILALMTGLTLFALGGLQQPAGTLHTGKAFRFNKVREGVYHAVGTGALAVVGNSSIIVNDNDVIVVDDHVSPAAASVLLDELKDITTKPVRTVINTHFHYDHAHGNQIFGKDVEIIGHEFTGEMLVITGDMLTAALSNMSDGFVNEWPATLDELKKLDFDTVLPGHGEAFTDKAKIDYFQAYLRDVWTEVSRLKRQGVSAEDAAKRADLTRHKDHFPIQGPGVPLIAVNRIYEVIDRAR